MTTPISGRIQVDIDPSEYQDRFVYADVTMEFILDEAKKLVKDTPVVWVEIQYKDWRSGQWEDWDISGDALEIDFTDPDNPDIRTLTSEEWKEASK